MRWLTTDRLRCLDCGRRGDVPTRWLSDGPPRRCPGCGSLAVERHDTPLRLLRDLLVLTNGA